ncbi:MAG TPA: WbqC family protein [Candidatus Paceibacterota bacterium]|nr:WbqC family protein [Candidatus Paceibacterota bacterium]
MEHLFFLEVANFEFAHVLMALSIRLTGYQPQYFPRLHYFARILDSDIFTISDYLQYVRKHTYPNPDGTTHRGVSYQAHTPIKTAQGAFMLDIPVKKGGEQGRQSLNEAEIDYASAWQQKNINSIHHNYHRATNYSAVFPSLSLVMMQRYGSLAECTIESMLWALSMILEVPCYRPKGPTLAQINDALAQSPFRLRRIVRMSETPILPADKEKRDANDWLVETCAYFNADEYYFGGTSAAAYMDFSRFEKAGIALVRQQWTCAPYRQQHGEFIPNLSIIDLLMNVPVAEAREILHPKSAAER